MSGDPLPDRLRLKAKCRVVWDENREQHLLLYPEGALVLNPTGRRVLDELDGERGLDEERVERDGEAGLDHVQISVQGATAEVSDAIAGTASFEDKMEACRLVRRKGFPLTFNVVLHRFNLHQVGELIELADDLGAERIELANTQYYGWALANREELMPPREQVEAAADVAEREKERREDLEIVWVLPDCYEDYPKPCMGGWARAYMTVSPGGMAMPCHAAARIDSLDFPSVRERSVRWIWEESHAFNAFRGTDWMQEPCRSCPRKEIDHGGCRCQAFALTGDAGDGGRP